MGMASELLGGPDRMCDMYGGGGGVDTSSLLDYMIGLKPILLFCYLFKYTHNYIYYR